VQQELDRMRVLDAGMSGKGHSRTCPPIANPTGREPLEFDAASRYRR
jgi:hypothetical protein